MTGITSGSFEQPDETQTPDRTRVELVHLGTLTAAHSTFQPGWRWSRSIKPIVGTASCQTRHVGTVASGRLHVVHEDGSETDLPPGSVYVIEPGHDAWVVGDAPFVSFEFTVPGTVATVERPNATRASRETPRTYGSAAVAPTDAGACGPVALAPAG